MCVEHVFLVDFRLDVESYYTQFLAERLLAIGQCEIDENAVGEFSNPGLFPTRLHQSDSGSEEKNDRHRTLESEFVLVNGSLHDGYWIIAVS